MLVPTVNGNVVLLPGHDDYELCTPTKVAHYHLDCRFNNDTEPKIIKYYDDHKIIYQDLEPLRKVIPRHNFTFLLWQLMCKYRNSKIVITNDQNQCKLCPHKGLLIDEANYCLGHGLQWEDNGELKYKNNKLFFRIKGGKSEIEIGWEFKNKITIISYDNLDCYDIFIELIAKDKNENIIILGESKYHTGSIKPGDQLILAAYNCP